MSHHVGTLIGAVATPFAGLPMLAQLPAPSAAEFGAWMLSAACLMVIIRQAIALKRDMKDDLKERPDPASTYQTKAAATADRQAQTTGCVATHAALNKLMDERNVNTNSAIGEIKVEIRGLSARIDSVLRLVPGGRDHD